MYPWTGGERLNERTQVARTETNMTITAPLPEHIECHSDEDAHAAARCFLARLIGPQDTALRWDPTYHLQGHTFVNGRELVVIAPRDDRHGTVVVTGEDWDEIHRAPPMQRQALLGSCSIASGRRLRTVTGQGVRSR